MKRRHLLLTAAITALDSLPGALLGTGLARSQSSSAVRKVAVLEASVGRRDTLRRALAALGWREGVNLDLQFVSAIGQEEHAAALAAAMVAGKPDVIATSSAITTRVLQQATRTIPIVMVFVVDPVGNGFVTSLGRPGGNITGQSNQQEDVLPKMVELLAQMIPRARHIGFLFNPNHPTHTAYQAVATRAAAVLRLTPVFLTADSPATIRLAIEQGKRNGMQGLVIAADPLFTSHAALLAQQVNAARLPAIYGQRLHVDQGGLMSYGANVEHNWHRAAYYIDRILKGSKPAELPVEQPTRFELVVNAKTVRALGLTIPQGILLLANEVLE